PCVHLVPCVHIGAVDQAVACVHLGPCVHILPNGLAAHIADQAHTFDQVTVPMQLHPQGDAAHPEGHPAHFIGDLAHFLEGDPQHPEGHVMTVATPRSAGPTGFRSSDEGLAAPIKLDVLHLSDDTP